MFHTMFNYSLGLTFEQCDLFQTEREHNGKLSLAENFIFMMIWRSDDP